jgi:hypothetical protein
MATVLLTWELGAGIGHLMNLRPIGEELVKRGHRVIAAVRFLSRAQEILGSAGITTVIGTHFQRYPQGIVVYNLRVADAHTYFVRDNKSEAEPVWVHNNSCVITPEAQRMYDIMDAKAARAAEGIVGQVPPPRSGLFGSTNFGSDIHPPTGKVIEGLFPNVEFGDNMAPGQRGVDMPVQRVQPGTPDPGFSAVEIKPRSMSGEIQFQNQLEQRSWVDAGYTKDNVAVFTYDAEGNIRRGF